MAVAEGSVDLQPGQDQGEQQGVAPEGQRKPGFDDAINNQEVAWIAGSVLPAGEALARNLAKVKEDFMARQGPEIWMQQQGSLADSGNMPDPDEEKMVRYFLAMSPLLALMPFVRNDMTDLTADVLGRAEQAVAQMDARAQFMQERALAEGGQQRQEAADAQSLLQGQVGQPGGDQAMSPVTAGDGTTGAEQQPDTTTSTTSRPLSVRGKNPFAMKKGGNYKGETDAVIEGLTDDFAIFETEALGFQAGSMQMDTNVYRYAKETGGTVAGVITKHAPPDDQNDTPAYIKDVQRTLAAYNVTKENDAFDSRDIFQHAAMFIAIASIEAGEAFPFKAEDLVAGMSNATRVEWIEATADREAHWGRGEPLFTTDEIEKLRGSLSISIDDEGTNITLNGVTVEIGPRGAVSKD